MADIGISTVLYPHEDPARVVESVRGLFPDWMPNAEPENSAFPQRRLAVILEGASDSIETLLESARDQRILDTALDAMSMRLEGDYTEFSISRQASMAGKLSFVLEERALGGEITVSIQMAELADWLQRMTWHPGRDSIPRSIGDGLSMSEQGEPVEWFDKRGNRTLGED